MTVTVNGCAEAASRAICQAIGGTVRQYRVAIGLSQKQLAGTEMTRSFISQLEAGRVLPSLNSLRIIAARLQRPVGDFLPRFTERACPAHWRQFTSVGESIRSARIGRGYTQQQLAEPECTRSYLSQVELGLTEPSLVMLVIWAKKLHIEPAWLVAGLPVLAVPPAGREIAPQAQGQAARVASMQLTEREQRLLRVWRQLPTAVQHRMELLAAEYLAKQATKQY